MTLLYTDIAIISHPDCVLHDAGQDHPERPERFRVVEAALKHYPFRSTVQFSEAPLVQESSLLLAHSEYYVDWIKAIAPLKGMVSIDADTWMNPFTLNAALRAAGALVLAVDLVIKGEARVVFCNVRPPGHHAERDKAMGFCIFNNVAVGVMHAINTYHLERIAIVDFDVHHGNGTQHIFQNDNRVLYCSSFEHPFYPGYDPALDRPHLLSVPLQAGTTSDLFRQKVAAAWFDKIRTFKPQLIFLSSGFDAHRDDPLADINLTKADYVWLTTEIAQIAKQCCDGKMISALEGGYNLAVLRECVPAHVDAMVGDSGFEPLTPTV